MDELQEICERLLRDANALSVVLIDKNGQELACAGGRGLLESPFWANVLTSGRFASFVGGEEFSETSYQDERDDLMDQLHTALVGDRAILVVEFDCGSSFALARLRLNEALEELKPALARALAH